MPVLGSGVVAFPGRLLFHVQQPQAGAGSRSRMIDGRQAQTCLAPPSTYQPCATDSLATRCRPIPPSAGSRSIAGAGIDSGARSLTSISQPPLPATTVATTGTCP